MGFDIIEINLVQFNWDSTQFPLNFWAWHYSAPACLLILREFTKRYQRQQLSILRLFVPNQLSLQVEKKLGPGGSYSLQQPLFNYNTPNIRCNSWTIYFALKLSRIFLIVSVPRSSTKIFVSCSRETFYMEGFFYVMLWGSPFRSQRLETKTLLNFLFIRTELWTQNKLKWSKLEVS